MRTRNAFTLVELLVVLAVIAILTAMSLPTVGRIRAAATRVQCAAQMADVGRFFQMYLNDSRDRLPKANTMPSVKPPITTAPSIVEILGPYVQDQTRVFHCPADRITRDDGPAGFETYFEREGSSYQYNWWLATLFAGKTMRQVTAEVTTKFGRTLGERIFVMTEYESFHGLPGTLGSTNYLFLPNTVQDFADPDLVRKFN